MTTDDLDFAAIIAASAPAPPPPSTPQPATPQPADADADADADAEADAADDQEQADASPNTVDDYVEPVDESSITGTRLSTLKTIQTLLELHHELHQPWEHTERAARGKKAAVYGRAWANALRSHSNGQVGHYYSHVAFAHLEELIVEHGHLMQGNDEVLEKGNRDMKRFRDMTYWGGDSSKTAQSQNVTQKRYYLVTEAQDGLEAVYEERLVSVPRQEASWVACMKMQVAADMLASRRLHHAESGRQGAKKAAKRVRDAGRDDMKEEGIAKVTEQVKNYTVALTHVSGA